MARVAHVARVARVACVARVGRVGRVGLVGLVGLVGRVAVWMARVCGPRVSENCAYLRAHEHMLLRKPRVPEVPGSKAENIQTYKRKGRCIGAQVKVYTW